MSTTEVGRAGGTKHDDRAGKGQRTTQIGPTSLTASSAALSPGHVPPCAHGVDEVAACRRSVRAGRGRCVSWRSGASVCYRSQQRCRQMSLRLVRCVTSPGGAET